MLQAVFPIDCGFSAWVVHLLDESYIKLYIKID